MWKKVFCVLHIKWIFIENSEIVFFSPIVLPSLMALPHEAVAPPAGEKQEQQDFVAVLKYNFY